MHTSRPISRPLSLCAALAPCPALQNITERSGRYWTITLRPEVDERCVVVLFVMAAKFCIEKDSRSPPFRRATSQNPRLASYIFGSV